MNELIKELSDKAWDYTDKNAKHDDHGLTYRDKFAELIIKECASVAMGYENYHGKILEHFGVI